MKLNANHLPAGFGGTYITQNKGASGCVTEGTGRRAFRIAVYIFLPWVFFLPFFVACMEKRPGATGQAEICTNQRSIGAKPEASLHQRKAPFDALTAKLLCRETGRMRDKYVTVSDKSEQIKK